MKIALIRLQKVAVLWCRSSLTAQTVCKISLLVAMKGKGDISMWDSKIQEVYCPNCGRKLCGLVDKNGGVKVQCDRCGAVMYSRKITPKKAVIEISM